MMTVTFLDISEDVLIYIFKLAIPEDDSPSNKHSPLNVSHTNRILRQITLENSCLWSYLCLKNVFKIKLGWKRLLDLWIERSGNAPLNYKLDFQFPSHSENIRNFSHLVLKLAEEHIRWQTIEINSTSGPLEDVRAQLTDMALLRVLLISIPVLPPFRLDFSKSKNLQHLSLEAVYGSIWWTISPTIISQELTVLNLWIMGSRRLKDCICCLDVLKACPKVEWFGLGMMRADESQSNNFQSEINGLSSVTLPNLKTMRLDAGLIPSDFFFQKLVTPFLIRLEYRYPSGIINYSSLRTFLQNSGSKLEELFLDNKHDEIFFMATIMPSIFEPLLSLRRLVVHDLRISPNLWTNLARNDDNDGLGATMLLPKLEILEISYPPEYFEGRGCDNFADMLVNRWRFNNGFQVWIVSGITDNIRKNFSNHELLQECISNGFKFLI